MSGIEFDQLKAEDVVRKTSPEYRAVELVLQAVQRGLSKKAVEEISAHLQISLYEIFEFPS